MNQTDEAVQLLTVCQSSLKKNKSQKKETNVGRRELSQTVENNSDCCACQKALETTR